MKKLSLILAVLLALLPILSLAEETVPSANPVDAEALYQQGLACTEGEEPDYEMALEWFLLSAEVGHVPSMEYLGWGYYNGYFDAGVPNYAAAQDWFLKALEADDSNDFSMCYLGLGYLGGYFTGTPDYETAKEWFSKSAMLGNASSMCNLGIYYGNGHFCDGVPDYDTSREWFEKSAAADHAHAAYMLGNGYENGTFHNGVPDGETALSYYMQAWNAGYIEVEGTIIDLLYEGITAEDGTVLFDPNHTKMLEFLNLLDQQGTENTYALSWLGWLLSGNSDQNVCEVDYARAAGVYQRGAVLGSDYCMMRLGEGYQNGTFHNGVPDGDMALSYYMQAWNAGYHDVEGAIIDLLCKGITAEDGTVLFAPNHAKMLEFLNQMDQQGTENTYALSWLGWLLSGNSDQNVCETDYARAVEVYQRGAALGSGYCMMQLGSIYEAGHLGEADLTAAEEWLAKAVEAGEMTAQEALDRVRNAQAQ